MQVTMSMRLPRAGKERRKEGKKALSREGSAFADFPSYFIYFPPCLPQASAPNYPLFCLQCAKNTG
jgi:hypothetical protein